MKWDLQRSSRSCSLLDGGKLVEDSAPAEFLQHRKVSVRNNFTKDIVICKGYVNNVEKDDIVSSFF